MAKGLVIMTGKKFDEVLENRVSILNMQQRSTSTLSNPAGWLINLLGGNSTASGAKVNSATALQIATVHGCILEIGRGIANMPLKKYKIVNGVTQKIDVDDTTLLLERPNPYQNSYDFFLLASATMAYKGNFYSWVVRDAANRAIAIHPINSESVTPYYNNGFLFYRVTTTTNVNLNINFPTDIAARDILHFKTMSMSNPLVGENPITLHAETMGINISAVTSQGKAQKDGILKFLVKSDKNLAPDQAKIVKNSLNDIIYNEDSIAVLPGGATVEKMQLSPEELKLLEVMKYTNSDICKIYGVSESIIGGTANEEQFIYFYQSCLTSYALPMEQEIKYKLCTESEKRQGVYFKFNFDSTLRATAEKRAEVYTKNIGNGVMTQNEARLKEDLSPVEFGNVHYSSAQWIPSNKMELWMDSKISSNNNKAAGQNNNPDGNNNDVQA